MNPLIITIPASALRIPSGGISASGEESVAPEVNDPVSFNAEGVVRSKSGENCEVEIRFINGERPGVAMKNEPETEATDDELAALAAEADMAGE